MPGSSRLWVHLITRCHAGLVRAPLRAVPVRVRVPREPVSGVGRTAVLSSATEAAGGIPEADPARRDRQLLSSALRRGVQVANRARMRRKTRVPLRHELLAPGQGVVGEISTFARTIQSVIRGARAIEPFPAPALAIPTRFRAGDGCPATRDRAKKQREEHTREGKARGAPGLADHGFGVPSAAMGTRATL
jgi:hypothetical protein